MNQFILLGSYEWMPKGDRRSLMQTKHEILPVNFWKAS
jgi:hypothetical protein